MIFDPFGDFDSQGYLRNFFQSKDIAKVKELEHASFQGNIERAMKALAKIEFIEYKHVLDIHRTLFSEVYPWAGQDRSITSPGLNIKKSGYHRMFAHPLDVRRAMDYALQQSREFVCERPGELMGLLAHAHPFLDGNGRTIMILHSEILHRVGLRVDWEKTDKTAYLTSLTIELNDPGKGHLDEYIR